MKIKNILATGLTTTAICVGISITACANDDRAGLDDNMNSTVGTTDTIDNSDSTTLSDTDFSRTPASVDTTHKSGDKQVKKAQQALNEEGFDLKVDGVMGTETRNAIREFQGSNDLQQTGMLDAATLSALEIEEDAARVPASTDPASTTTPASDVGTGQIQTDEGMRPSSSNNDADTGVYEAP